MFKPTKPQARFKTQLYAKHPNINLSDYTPVKLQTLTGNRSVQTWAEDAEFWTWLCDKESVRRALEAGAEDAVELLLTVINEPDVGPQGRVTAANQIAAARLILEFAGFTPPSHKVVEYRDKDIEKMNENELKEFITKNLKLVK
jgi:hypothetical protein